MYFQNINTIEEAKNLFRDLCKKLHPDTSGYDSQNDFVKMFTEFKKFKPSKNENNESFDGHKFYDLLRKFDVLTDVKINFVGTFIWLEDQTINATFIQKDTIKSILLDGFNNARFAPTKKLCYFSPSDYVQKSKSKKDFEQIKKAYGSKSYTSKGLFQLAN